MSEIDIRFCTRLDEFKRCVELEGQIWGFDVAELVPLPLLVVMSETGGQVIGAFDGSAMIGFVAALVAYREGRVFLHSHMAAVLPAYRDRGIGRRLKLEQRADALRRGMELVEWTFDPLEIKNAFFNIERLGAIGRRYLPDHYGRTSSPLHAGLPTDRLVAEWWVSSIRVEDVIAGRGLAHLDGCERILVPSTIDELKRRNPAEAERVQTGVRERFLDLFAKGYVVKGFERSDAGGTYLLERDAN